MLSDFTSASGSKRQSGELLLSYPDLRSTYRIRALTRRVENFYSKLEPRDAIVMVLDDIATALGETPTPNGAS